MIEKVSKSYRVKEYRAWRNMINRCEYPNARRFDRYGGRGIRICSRWRKSFEAFLRDVGRAPTPSHTIGRIDNNGNYEPGNVEWQTRSEQMNNMASNRVLKYNGESRTLTQWANRIDISENILWHRIFSLKWSVRKSLTVPVRKKSDGSDGLSRKERWVQKKKHAGLCTYCGQQPIARHSRSSCLSCLKKLNAIQRRTYSQRKRRGLCVACPNKATPPHVLCDACREKLRERHKKPCCF